MFTLLIIVGAVVYSNLSDLRGNRYCEILLEYDDATEVWGTQGLNRCSQADWEQLDFKEIQLSNNANSIIANGPRYFVVNGSEGMVLPEEETRFFGNMPSATHSVQSLHCLPLYFPEQSEVLLPLKSFIISQVWEPFSTILFHRETGPLFLVSSCWQPLWLLSVT